MAYISVSIGRDGDRQTDRQTDRQRGRDRHRQTNRQTDRETFVGCIALEHIFMHARGNVRTPAHVHTLTKQHIHAHTHARARAHTHTLTHMHAYTCVSDQGDRHSCEEDSLEVVNEQVSVEGGFERRRIRV